MEKITMSYSQFAFSVGSSDRLTQEFSTGWHLEYVKADSETRQARRTEFMVNYLMGNLKITKSVAERFSPLAGRSVRRSINKPFGEQVISSSITSFALMARRRALLVLSKTLWRRHLS